MLSLGHARRMPRVQTTAYCNRHPQAALCWLPNLQSLDRQRGHRRAAIREGSGDATCVKEDSEAAATGLSFPEMMDASPGIEKPRRNGSCAGALADRQHPQTIISVVTLAASLRPRRLLGLTAPSIGLCSIIRVVERDHWSRDDLLQKYEPLVWIILIVAIAAFLGFILWLGYEVLL